MKKIYLLATALAALVGCTSEDFTGDQNLREANGSGPISFGYDIKSATRTENTGATAATNLGNQFIVYGEKNEVNYGEEGANVSTAPNAGTRSDLVFPNYQVNWVANANSTTSNTSGWEYVGYTHSDNYRSHIQTCADPTAGTPTLVNALNAVQTIKYWDNSATSYTFTAVSAAKHLTDSKTDIENGYITIQKNTTGSTVYDKGYKITATADADLSTLYISDRVSNTTKTSPVTLTFRNVLSQIRVGIYETIPGYDISEIKFFVNTSGETPTQEEPAKVSGTDAFGAVCPNVKASGAQTLTVTYGDGKTYIENQPIITPATGSVNNLILGTNTSTLTTTGTPKYLGITAASPTWDTNGGAFTSVFPQINNTTNLSLKCNYTLYNSNTGEKINITNKTATVPAKYLQWKPNYKYTYLFKITDSDLSPITFDAIEIVTEDGQAEYITTVTQPSITTFGVKGGNYTSGKNEYEAGSDIYVTVTSSGNPITPALGTNINVYRASVAVADATNFPITEASVAESLAHPSGNKITVTSINSDSGTNFTAAPAKATDGVPSEDGKWLSTAVVLASKPDGWPTGYYTDRGCTEAASSSYADGTYYQKWTDALKLTGVKYTTTESVVTAIVIEYIEATNKYYKVIKVAPAP